MLSALSSPNKAHDRYHFALYNGQIAKLLDQTAIVQISGLIPQYALSGRRHSTQVYEIHKEDTTAADNVRILDILGMSVGGVGGFEGLHTFGYRFSSSERLSHHVIRCLEHFRSRLEHNQVPGVDEDPTPTFGTDLLLTQHRHLRPIFSIMRYPCWQ